MKPYYHNWHYLTSTLDGIQVNVKLETGLDIPVYTYVDEGYETHYYILVSDVRYAESFKRFMN